MESVGKRKRKYPPQNKEFSNMAGANKAYFDKETGKWVFPAPEAKKTANGSVYDPTIARLPISRAKIHDIAVAAGFTANADTDKGRAIQEATFATKFIEVAVEHELATLAHPKTNKK